MKVRLNVVFSAGVLSASLARAFDPLIIPPLVTGATFTGLGLPTHGARFGIPCVESNPAQPSGNKPAQRHGFDRVKLTVITE